MLHADQGDTLLMPLFKIRGSQQVFLIFKPMNLQFDPMVRSCISPHFTKSCPHSSLQYSPSANCWNANTSTNNQRLWTEPAIIRNHPLGWHWTQSAASLFSEGLKHALFKAFSLSHCRLKFYFTCYPTEVLNMFFSLWYKEINPPLITGLHV